MTDTDKTVTDYINNRLSVAKEQQETLKQEIGALKEGIKYSQDRINFLTLSIERLRGQVDILTEWKDNED
jgi:predicted  nucleic acid-binding Zn-ribbon protein